jgi:hypothetical protein
LRLSGNKGNPVGRVIHIQNGTTIRNQALRQIAWILREMMSPNIPEMARRDMAAGILFSLRTIQGTIEQAALAWEKRDYWVKADRFRMDWRWVEQTEKDWSAALQREDWGACAAAAARMAGKVSGVELPKRKPAVPPWQNAWRQLKEKG